MEFYIVPGAIFLDDLPGYHADSPLDQFVSHSIACMHHRWRHRHHPLLRRPVVTYRS